MINQDKPSGGVNPVNSQENEPYRRRHFSIFWPVLLIALGAFLFLNNVGVVPGSGWDLVLRLWPLLLIAGGLDGLLRRQGLVWSVVLIGLGLAFLLSNLGYLSISAWEVIVRFWPVFLVALGLDILIGRRGPWAQVIGAVVGLLLVGGIAAILFVSPGISNQRTETVNFAMNNVTQASGSINMAVGQLDLTSGSAATALMDGTVKLGTSGALLQNGPTGANPAAFSLGADNSSYVSFGVNDTDHWTLHLNPAVTYSLNVNMGVGDANITLNDLSVSYINFNMAVGSSEVRLPARGSVTGEIKGAVGEETIYVPKGAVVRLNLDTGLTSVSFPPDFTRSGDLVTSPSQSDGPSITLTLAQALGAINVRYLP
jgi:hypothetical protein